MTTVLAIWGALLSTISVAFFAVREWRDRPRLDARLVLTFEDGRDTGDPFAGPTIEVVNVGRQATALVEVMLVYCFDRDRQPDPPHGEGVLLLSPDDEPRVLAPYEVARWTYNMWDEVYFPIDAPVRGYVLDSRNRGAWTQPEVVLRHLAELDYGWTPPPGTPHEYLDNRPELHTAPPLVPRWHVWKAKHLRVPTDAYGE